MININELPKKDLYTTNNWTPYTGPAVEETKMYKVIYTIKNGQKHGPCFIFSKDESKTYLNCVKHYWYGKSHGTLCRYDDKGRITSINTYWEGKHVGPRIVFKGGRIRSMDNTQEYCKTGVQSKFSDDGVVCHQALYDFGVHKYDFEDPLLPIPKEK